GSTPSDSTFTVRRIASGVGVEKVFPIHSPKIEKIEVKKVASVRRAKLFFLRGRRGKSARLSERFTTAEEFAVAAPVVEEEGTEEVEGKEGIEEKAEKKDQEPKEEVPVEEKAEAKEEQPKEEVPKEEEKEEEKTE
ncbi:MAG: 50S ribosomal protein L19, partial [Candidatus Peribacteraceae bacterium]|nr:50S ribosomal protein L19 [Candidatus Peribacteraceae bacterium]